MKISSAPWPLWLVPIAFLLVATAQMSLGYYTATRIVVFAVAVFAALVSWNAGRFGRWGSLVLAPVAVAFNPFVPMPFTREVWVALDWVCIALFAAHLIVVRLKLLPTNAASKADN
jgi:hypothetical protein